MFYKVAVDWVLSPLTIGLLGIIYEFYQIYRFNKKYKSSSSPKNYFDSRFNKSIFQFLQKNSDDDESNIDTGKQLQNQKKKVSSSNNESSINDNNDDLRQHLISNDNQISDQNQSNNENDEDKIQWFEQILAKKSKQVYFTIIYSYILIAPMLVLLPHIFFWNKINKSDAQTGILSIIEIILQIFLQNILHFSIIFYRIFISGQNVLLLANQQQNKNNNIRIFLVGCLTRSFFYTSYLFLIITFLCIINYITQRYGPFEIFNNPIYMIIKQIIYLVVSAQGYTSYKNQKILKKQRNFSLYNNFYKKYYNYEKLEKDFKEIYKTIPNKNEKERDEYFKCFIDERRRQAENYCEKMEDNFINNTEFQIDNIITNRQMKKQIQIKTLSFCITIFTPLIIAGVSVYEILQSTPINIFYHPNPNDQATEMYVENLSNLYQYSNITSNHTNISYLFKNKDHESEYLPESQSVCYDIYAFVLLLQAFLVLFIRKSYKKSWIFNQNSLNTFKS